VYERRQRSWLGGLAALGVLAGAACTPVSPTAQPGANPTPTAAPDLVSGARNAVSSAQTVVPAAQGTLQAAATAVSPQIQYVVGIMSTILGGGVQVQMEQEPPDATNNAQVRSVHLHAVDATGTYAKLDKNGREKTAEAVLLGTSQFYPQATVDLLIVDANNRTLMTASRAPGEEPKLDD
jgi:hypothetical protein